MVIEEYKMHGDFNHGARMEQLYTIQFPGDDKLEDFAKAWQKLTEDGCDHERR